MSKPRHFLNIRDMTKAELRQVLDRAHELKKARKGLRKGEKDTDPQLAGYVLALIFESSSTRTRVSFDMAMSQLGGQTIVLNKGEMQLDRGESMHDTAKVLSRYVDAMMVRVHDHDSLSSFAEASDVPVINGLTNLNHPCQIIADLMTYEERHGSIEDAVIAWVGDGNNVANSYIEAAGIFGFKLNLACPISLAPNKEIMDWANANGANIHLMKDPVKAVTGANAVVTDSWVSMGDRDAAKKRQLLASFQVTKSLMSQSNEGAIFMHCLPAGRGQEVTCEVIDGPNAVVFDEAENRVHAQKAILQWCFELL